MTEKELLDNWKSESDAANDCIIEILESYMEFITLARFAVLAASNPDLDSLGRKRVWRKFKDMADQRRTHWEPILGHAKAAKEKANEE